MKENLGEKILSILESEGDRMYVVELARLLSGQWGWILYALLGGPISAFAMVATIALNGPWWVKLFIPLTMGIAKHVNIYKRGNALKSRFEE